MKLSTLQVRRKQKIAPVLSRHCLGTLVVKDEAVLFGGEDCVNEIRNILREYDVTILGEQLHKFPNKSFTLLICLAESHISIHTWPERLTVQLDVFLCNYENNNTYKCEGIYNDIVDYFGAAENNTSILERL